VVSGTYDYDTVAGVRKTVLVLEVNGETVDERVAAMRVEEERRRAEAEAATYRPLSSPIDGLDCPLKVIAFRNEAGKGVVVLKRLDTQEYVTLRLALLAKEDQSWVRTEWRRVSASGTKPPPEVEDSFREVTTVPTEIAHDETVDLLPLFRSSDHVISGEWTRSGNSVRCAAGENSRIVIPVHVNGTYEIECEFCRHTGNDVVLLMLPVGNTRCGVAIDAEIGKVHGMSTNDGAPTVVQTDGPMRNGVRHRLSVLVTAEDAVVGVRARLNGDLLFDWSGSSENLVLHANDTLPDIRMIGLMVWNSEVEVTSLTMRLRQGGTAYRLPDKIWRSPLRVIADQPPTTIDEECVSWNGRKYWLSRVPMQLNQAQALAVELGGRVLTVSSPEEEEFLTTVGGQRRYWLAGWRRPNKSLPWRDDQNEILRYVGGWSAKEPSADGWNLKFSTGEDQACIEWGEEYPEGE
jgi:hypothetical protein